MTRVANRIDTNVSLGDERNEDNSFNLFEGVSEHDFGKLVKELAEIEKIFAEEDLKHKQEKQLTAVCSDLDAEQISMIKEFALAVREGKISIGDFVLNRLEAARAQALRSRMTSEDRAKEAARSQKRRDEMTTEDRAKEAARGQRRLSQKTQEDRDKEAARKRAKRAGLSPR